MLFDDKLINLVEKNDVLYNRDNRCYLSISVKKKVWQEIARKMGTTEDEVIKRYRELRDRFVKFKRNQFIKNDQRKPAEIVRRMNFLMPHIFNRRRDGSKIIRASKMPLATLALLRSQEAFEASNDDTTNTLGNTPLAAPKLHKTHVKLEPKPEALSTNSESEYAAPADDVDSANSTASQPDVEVFYEAINNFKKICKSQVESNENEALNGFVQMISATIEGMSGTKQAKAMMRVTEVIMKIKMEKDD